MGHSVGHTNALSRAPAKNHGSNIESQERSCEDKTELERWLHAELTEGNTGLVPMVTSVLY